MQHPDFLVLDQRQFAEWMAFYEVHPWGEEIEDLRHGINTAALVNIQRGKGRAVKPQDFMVHKPEKPKQTWEDMKREARRIALVTGGTVTKKSANA